MQMGAQKRGNERNVSISPRHPEPHRKECRLVANPSGVTAWPGMCSEVGLAELSEQGSWGPSVAVAAAAAAAAGWMPSATRKLEEGPLLQSWSAVVTGWRARYPTTGAAVHLLACARPPQAHSSVSSGTSWRGSCSAWGGG